ncbi:MAG TPA: hypothetical protein DDW30_08450 [Clostridiales bacterium]|nr:hypothetical protein [Clostridiales bacterium]
MAKKKGKLSNNQLLEGGIMILLGVLFLLLKGETIIHVAMTVFGVALLVLAILDFLDHKTLPAIVKAVFAVVVLVFGWALVDVALIVLAAVILIWGIYELYLKLRVHLKGSNALSTILLYISPILDILLGLLLLFNRGGTVAVISIVVGILLIVDGVMLIWDGTKKKSK